MQGSNVRVHADEYDVRERRPLFAPFISPPSSLADALRLRAAATPHRSSCRVTDRLRRSQGLRCAFAFLFLPVCFALCTTS
jgi:hypothetical protein